MINRRSQKTSLLGVIFLVCLSFLGNAARANVLTVSPAFVRMSVSAATPVAETTITLRNDSNTTSSYDIRLVDVDVATGRLASLATVSTQTESIFQLSERSVRLDAAAAKPITLKAVHSDTLAPGGHYAAIEIKRREDTRTTQQPVVQIVNVGIFLTKEDGIKRDIRLLAQGDGGIRFSIPTTYDVELRNDGNVDVTPRGFVALTGGTTEYAKVQFNDTSRPIFAGQSSSYAVPLSGKRVLWPGKYSVVVSYRADSEQQRIYVEDFWYIPLYIPCAGVILLLVSVFVVRRKARAKRSTVRSLPVEQTQKVADEVASVQAIQPTKQKQRIMVTEMAREAVRTHTPRTRKKPAKKQARSKKAVKHK